MNDPRLETWLRVTREALAAPPDGCVEAVAAALTARGELAASLEADPRARCADGLRAELLAAEDALQQRSVELVERLRARLSELRTIQSGVRGYRPCAPQIPKLISRNV
jgi:hypothetical protein